MNANNTEDKRYLEAKDKVRSLKVFYIHVIGYLVLVGLVVYNQIIIDEGPYKNTITWINWSTVVAWGIFLAIHAWSTFKGGLLFNKKWEERKIQEYLDKNQEEQQRFE